VGGKEDGAHFIGSIVYIHDSIYTTANIKELVIIDGQQRLTTLMLIYIVLYRIAKQLGDDSLFEEINETYLINKFVSNTEKLKLSPTENNDRAFRFLLSNEPISEYSEYSNIVENFRFFAELINQNNYNVILNGLSRLMFVEISLERDKDDPHGNHDRTYFSPTS
jgi:uncharacterized protein with ParB-like and HNH nuclease domain